MKARIVRNMRQCASIPRIDIEKTVTNDIQLMLNMLMPTKDITRLIRNYQTILADHHAEMRLIKQVINQRNGHYSETAEQKEAESTAEDMKQLNSRKVLWLSSNGSLLR